VRLLAAFGRFWWDFVVGDDWKVAAGVALVLVAAAVVVASLGAVGTWLAPLVAAVLVAGFLVGVAVGVRGR
jgi:hypothetical protein